MGITWTAVHRELSGLRRAIDLAGLSPEALDTLWGSLWALNYRYTTVGSFVADHGLDPLVKPALIRLQCLTNDPSVVWPKTVFSDHRKVGLGTYGWKYGPEIITAAIKYGVDLIDTAEGYGYGRVESALGKALVGLGRMPEIATKVSRNHMSYRAVYRAGERSYARLGVASHYQVHCPNAAVPLQATLRGMLLLHNRGLIQSFGMSNVSVDILEAAQQILSSQGETICSVQLRYCLSDRRIESWVLPYCQRYGIRVLAYSPLGQDFLALRLGGNRIVGKIAKACGCTEAQVALAWLWSRAGVVPIPRTNSVRHLRENLDARTIVLSNNHVKLLERAFPVRIY